MRRIFRGIQPEQITDPICWISTGAATQKRSREHDSERQAAVHAGGRLHAGPAGIPLLSASTRNYGHDAVSAYVAAAFRSALSPEGTRTVAVFVAIEGLRMGPQW